DNYVLMARYIMQSIYQRFLPDHVKSLTALEQQSLSDCQEFFGSYTSLAELHLKLFKINQYLHRTYGGGSVYILHYVVAPYAVDANKRLFEKAVDDGFIKFAHSKWTAKILENLRFNRKFEILHSSFPDKPGCGKLDTTD